MKSASIADRHGCRLNAFSYTSSCSLHCIARELRTHSPRRIASMRPAMSTTIWTSLAWRGALARRARGLHQPFPLRRQRRPKEHLTVSIPDACGRLFYPKSTVLGCGVLLCPVMAITTSILVVLLLSGNLCGHAVSLKEMKAPNVPWLSTWKW